MNNFDDDGDYKNAIIIYQEAFGLFKRFLVSKEMKTIVIRDDAKLNMNFLN